LQIDSRKHLSRKSRSLGGYLIIAQWHKWRVEIAALISDDCTLKSRAGVREDHSGIRDHRFCAVGYHATDVAGSHLCVETLSDRLSIRAMGAFMKEISVAH
jgi:hypothetical protein